jgi:hypothetical protein
MNEFGQIVGFSANEQGIPHAAVWTPIAGPLAVTGNKGSAERK